MDFNEYQKLANKTAHYPKIGAQFVYPAIGLSGEVGEFMNKIKKVFRDDEGKLTHSRKEELVGELGDVLWYVAQIATDLDLDLSDVAEGNISKLKSRQERGQIGGSGDVR